MSTVSLDAEIGLPTAAAPLFPGGQLFATPAALALLQRLGVSPFFLFARHLHGDWGDIGEDDAHANQEALASGQRLLSRYDLPADSVLWIITETDRSVTTVLLPEDY
jgi:hypothetical protein